MVMRPHGDRRVAAFATLPFQLRGLAPIAQRFRHWLQTSSIDALEAWAPDLVLANDAGAFAMLRHYCDRHGAWLIGLRHGIANKYIGPDPEFALADYVCGSEWDVADFERHGIRPIRGMLLTGNPWVDDVFRVQRRAADERRPTILFAPTWNPETSAAAFFDENLVPAIRAVYPESRIVIKPHPLMLSAGVGIDASTAGLFGRWVESYRRAAATDARVSLADDPALSIAALYADADILVSDGSSLVFEFALFERPILLYSSSSRVSHWSAPWDAAAPANAMRDVGDEFRSREDFAAALTHAFDRHARIHRIRQQTYSSDLFGRYRDGRSAERAAEALGDLPWLDVTVVTRKPNPRFVVDVQSTLRNARVHVEHTREHLPASRFVAVPAQGQWTLTLRPGGEQRFADGHCVSFATRQSSATEADLDAPLLSFRGDAKPTNADWVRADGAVQLRLASNSARPAWQRHVVVSVDVDHAGRCSTLTAIVDATANPSHVIVQAGVTPAPRIGLRRFVTTDDLVARAASDPEAERILVQREQREALSWRTAEIAIATRMASGLAWPSLLESQAAWLAFELRARGVRNVAVFGAGAHTAHLLPIWNYWHGPRVHCVVVSDATTAPRAILGVPVKALGELDVNHVDAVLLSSASHEGAMANACERHVPELPVFALWHHSDATGPTTAADRQIYAVRRVVPFAVAACRRQAIGEVVLAGARSSDEWLAAAVWQAWDGPEIVSSPATTSAVTLWCSPQPPPACGLPARRILRLWPDRLPPVAPGLLPRHQTAV